MKAILQHHDKEDHLERGKAQILQQLCSLIDLRDAGSIAFIHRDYGLFQYLKDLLPVHFHSLRLTIFMLGVRSKSLSRTVMRLTCSVVRC